MFRCGMTCVLVWLSCVHSALAWQAAPLCALDGPLGPDQRQKHFVLDEGNRSCVAPATPERIYGIPWTIPPTVAEARAAFAQADLATKNGRPSVALEQLSVVENTFPRLTDRIAYLRGQLLMAAGQPEAACDAYLTAVESLDRDVEALARVGFVECGLAMDADDAAERLQLLLRRYPKLPTRHALELQLAQYEERRGQPDDAIRLYRAIDIQNPASAAAAQARSALTAMGGLGIDVPPLTTAEAISRTERLVRGGPFKQARQDLRALLRHKDLTASEQARLHVLAARMARTEGRWDAAAKAVESARSLGMGQHADRYMPPNPARLPNPERTDIDPQLQQELDAILGRRSLNRARPYQLERIVQLAVEYGEEALATDVLEVMVEQGRFPAGILYNAALTAVGTARDETVAHLLSGLLEHRNYGVSARYHYARALERLGALDLAIEEYHQVQALDDGHTPYYAMWAEQRLWTIDSHLSQSCLALTPTQSTARSCSSDAANDSERNAVPENLVPLFELQTVLPTTPDVHLRRRALRLLKPLLAEHAAAFPWLERAWDLILLDRYQAAADELSQAYLAYRDARGGHRLRSGLESVFANGSPRRYSGNRTMRRSRARLDQDTRNRLAELAALLGDHGIAVRFAGHETADAHPLAYATLVEAASQRYGLDPDLLFAVMRVESVYNRRIISHVGAVGLTQIMPRTGRLIAQAMGRTDFQVTDLLDPQTNLNFSAWYLASLIRRFEGHVPLAVAAYNGGPHNVRLWLRQRPASMPLDVFLEHIPFTETHRYVRRVLTHYAAYRTKRALPMPRLSMRLPTTTPDMMAF